MYLHTIGPISLENPDKYATPSNHNAWLWLCLPWACWDNLINYFWLQHY